MGHSMEPAGIRFYMLRFNFPREASVVGEMTNSNGFDTSYFELQIIVFVKESDKKYHTVPSLDFKISKFQVSRFPILDISSQIGK